MRIHLSLFAISLLFYLTGHAALHVVIDPGHGGADHGAVYGSAKESDISLAVAHQLKQLLDGNKNFQTTLTRTHDQNISLPERVQLAEKVHGELFLSIHTNASPDLRARGIEIYFQNQLPADEESLFLANTENQAVKVANADNSGDLSKKGDVLAIIEDLKRNTKMVQSHWLSQQLLQVWSTRTSVGHSEGNTIRQAPFYVISRTNIPSVLVELGFISNPKEAEQLTSMSYQKEIAQRIYRGLLSYKEMVDKADLTRLQ